MIKVEKSGARYQKVVETYVVPPTALEMFFWYSGTHSGILSTDNPYRAKNLYSTKTSYVEVKDES